MCESFYVDINIYSGKKKEKKKHIINTSVNFTGQKLEKLETRKLENDFRVREVQKTRK